MRGLFKSGVYQYFCYKMQRLLKVCIYLRVAFNQANAALTILFLNGLLLSLWCLSILVNYYFRFPSI